jgi:hypothetical protein
MRAAAARPVRERIGVLTFHRCINYGSYWQARCLVGALRAPGREVVLLDHRSFRITRLEWINALEPTRPIPTPVEHREAYRRKLRLFLDAFDRLPLSPPFPLSEPAQADGFDAVVIGSDEVWNFRHPWYSATPAFFGEGLTAARILAYAASAGNHDAADGLGADWTDRLGRFNALSVRDENTQALVATALGRSPVLTVDPCLLAPEIAARPAPGGALIVYGHDFEPHLQAQAKAWARANGAPIVSLGYFNDWADEQLIDASPDVFATRMGAARAVVTNFFHGCVFSLINRRPFLAAAGAYRSRKVSDLLIRFGLGDRLMTPGSSPDRVAAALSLAPNEEVMDAIATARRASQIFLDESLAAS